MKKVWLIATHEFLSAVRNRGFIIGLLLMPALFAFMAVVYPRVLRTGGPQLRGEVAIVDPTGQVAGALRDALAPEAVARRRAESATRALVDAPAVVRDAARGATVTAARTGPPPPDLRVVEHAASANLQQEKAWLVQDANPRRLALVVVHDDAVAAAAGSSYGSYDIFVPESVDERVETALYEAAREALIAARIRARNLDRATVEAMLRVPRSASVTVSPNAERRSNRGLNRSLPFIFAGLLVFGVMIGGQTLLTSTVEEKSSRVVEVLLSAVSPLQLMAGKILGQLLVSLLVLSLYIAGGGAVLSSLALIGLLDPMLVVYLFVFFLITYLLFSAVFTAVGAAVTEMREAQSLITPVMLVLMAPWVFAFPIGQQPNSSFSVAMSFIPPVNTFAMMMRLASATPPPTWQVLLTILIGVASAVAAMWFAAKVFKVGLLMHGKPPNFATLVRWARAA